MQNVEAALRVCKKTFDDRVWVDGSIEAVLRLCTGLIVDEEQNFCVGWFSYWPDFGKAVEAVDIERLKTGDLKTGPLLHFAVWVSSQPSYKPVRLLIKMLNPWGVTAHRWKNGKLRFCAVRNAGWRDDKDTHVSKVGVLADIRRQQEQAKE